MFGRYGKAGAAVDAGVGGSSWDVAIRHNAPIHPLARLPCSNRLLSEAFVNTVVFSALVPVMAMIGVGMLVGRARWLGPRAVRGLSTLAFMFLTPVLLFRAMSRVHLEQLDLLPALVYSLVVVLVFVPMLLLQGAGRRAAVLALAATYGNSVMIGIPLVTLAYGEAGLVTLFTVIPVHSLLLLTSATVVAEAALAREQAASAANAARLWSVGLQALRRAVIHPVPLPIILGLMFSQTGWAIPALPDQAMFWVGRAYGPIALFLVGVSLANLAIGKNLRAALLMTGIKNVLVPVLAGTLGWAFGLTGVPLAVVVLTAAMPVGSNAFLFSQRYATAESVTTASVAVSTAASVLSVSLVLALFPGV